MSLFLSETSRTKLTIRNVPVCTYVYVIVMKALVFCFFLSEQQFLINHRHVPDDIYLFTCIVLTQTKVKTDNTMLLIIEICSCVAYRGQ